MSIETFEDSVWNGLRQAGFTDAELFNAADRGLELNSLVAHAHMKGRTVGETVAGIAKLMREGR